ncbi:hypothetical protein Purlil1_13366 [Purpureocillium lilacinum]|uniref:Uncharacterized protein n=1 Tax=Purpureocillium lilacinum TaxID=33203 RepID=A0ABR0BE89_PURLI|nr:hypothetical protein Purlil1_13366 [Purpureocillium lilacinum]
MDPLEQVDRIVVAAELRYNMGPFSGPLLETSLEKRLARLNNFRGSPAHMETLVFDGAGESSGENPSEGSFDIKRIRVALNRLCELLPYLKPPGCKPAPDFNNETHSDEVILTAVFVVASVCSASDIGFPNLSGLPPLDSVPLHCIIEKTTAHIWRRILLQQTQRKPPPGPVTSKKDPFHGQLAHHPPGPPQFPRPPFHHNPGNIALAFTKATEPSGRLQKQAPPSSPSRPGSASSSQSGSTVQSSPKYTPSGASAAAPKHLGQDKPNETPMLAPGAMKPPPPFLVHELTARLEQASGAKNSSPVKGGFPLANPGVSDQRVASPVAAEPVSPSSVASHDSRPVNTPRSGHTEVDWEDVNWNKN